MSSLAKFLAPAGVTSLPAEESSWRAALYALVGRLTLPQWSATYGHFDWEGEAARLRDPNLIYPHYYLCNRHGVHGGYLTGWHALGWSFASAFYGLPALYQQLADDVGAEIAPNARVIDIGAGTGDWLLALRSRLPYAHFAAADLAPHMLAALRHRWAQTGYDPSQLALYHAAGENLPLPDASYDIVTALLVLHELPPGATQALFAEARRLLKPGGTFMTFDAIQRPIPLQWVNEVGVRAVAEIFREPDFVTYAHSNIPTIAQRAGFGSIRTRYLGRLPWKFQIQEALAL